MSTDIIALAVAGFCVLLFLTKWLPLCVTGIAGCAMMVLFRVASFKEVFSGFGSDIVVLMASAMVVGIAMFQTGAAQVIGSQVVKLSRKSEFVFLTASCVVSGLLAMFLANTAILASFIPIIESVCRSSPQMKRRNLLLPIACSVMYGGASTLIGCTPQLTANGVMKSLTGEEMGMWTLTIPGLALFALFILYMVTAGYRLNNKIWSRRPEADMQVSPEKLKQVESPAINKRKLGAMYAILALMIASYIAGALPPAMTALLAALLCVVAGCCDVSTVIKELQWDVVVFLASCLGLANALTTAGSGKLMGEWFSRFLGGTTSPFAIFAALVFLTLLISQFITNSTAIIVVLPIALTLCTQYGFNYMPFTVGITLAASIACCTPLAAAQITMTQVAGYEFGDYVKFGILPTLLGYAAILLVVPLVYPLRG